MYARITFIADEGMPHYNTAQFRKVRDNLYELKGGKVRMFGFFDDKARRFFLLTHGWRKGPAKEQTQEIDRAERLRDEYIASRQSPAKTKGT